MVSEDDVDREGGKAEDGDMAPEDRDIALEGRELTPEDEDCSDNAGTHRSMLSIECDCGGMIEFLLLFVAKVTADRLTGAVVGA